MSNKLEILLRKAGRELSDYQVARFFKVPEEMQQTPCDFIGYTNKGRAILIEAKLVTRTSLPINVKPGLLPHQFNELCDAHRAGAIALICWANKGVCATIDLTVVFPMITHRSSIPWDEIPEEYMRPMTGPDAHLKLLDRWLPIA